MFIDEARIEVQAGSGGDGCNSLYRDRVNRIGTPDGGPGGDGGNVILEADSNVHTLLDFQYRRHFKADSGYNGSSNHKKGARGQDVHIKVPAGTIIRDSENGFVLRDLAKVGDSVIIAKGGFGGRGNSRGREALKGEPGETKIVELELKLIAEAGIIGYPNAGKSTLISRISSARPKIASYPFTTKEPVLGMVKLHDDFNILVADIPGLIEGAHKGRGLGHKFLRHIERTKVLIHIVDIAGTDCRDPYSDYVNLNKELKAYSKELARKKQIIVLNKTDCPQAKENLKAFRKRTKKKYFEVSALTGKGVKELLIQIGKTIKAEEI
ncbi:MAG: GTPase ObgE [Candidatus Omnitrophica bacterium]|nr:GTPase ObgE [Candidatus Omnitrophota bacterium]